MKGLQNKKILLVNDKEFFRTFLSDVLQDFGYKVFTANHGEDALAILRQNNFNFDLYIVDLHIPYLIGLDLIQIIRKERPIIPVIAVTSMYKRQDDIAALKDLNVNSFLYSCTPIEDILYSVNQKLYPQEYNKRLNNRQILHFSLKFKHNGEIHPGNSFNITEKGIYIVSDYLPATGDSIAVELDLPGADFLIKTKAIVKHIVTDELVGQPRGFGVVFEKLKNEEYEKFKKYLFNLKAES
ncbi:MAG: response regulator [Pseudomonadota bacterium]